MSKNIWFTKSYCTCSDCDFECKEQKDMIKHCKSKKHDGEVTLQKAIHFKEKEDVK